MPRLIKTFIIWHLFLALLGTVFLLIYIPAIFQHWGWEILFLPASIFFIVGNLYIAQGLAFRKTYAWKMLTSNNWDFGLRRHSFNAPEIREYFGLPLKKRYYYPDHRASWEPKKE